MGICSARRRSSKRIGSSRHTKYSCWRNPFVVFFICFVVLGSLRFRVPARSKRVASTLLQKRLQHQRRKRAEAEESLVTMTTTNSNNGTNTSTSSTISYVLMENGADSNGRSYQKYKAVEGDSEEPITMEHWATAIVTASDEKDPAIAFLTHVVESSPYEAVFFETPPVIVGGGGGTVPHHGWFEFVLVDAPQLHTRATDKADENSFRKAHTTATVTNDYGSVFPNLGGDAMLIVPKSLPAEVKNNNNNCYAHLASFIRTAPPHQVAALWKMAAQTLLDQMSLSTNAAAITNQQPQHPIWFSTSGMGINWLHFRIDRTPKYYSYEPYKQIPHVASR